MPETKEKALTRAKTLGFNKSSVIKGKDGWFIAPRGIKSTSAKKAYAGCRSGGKEKEYCAKVSWSIEKKNK